MLEEGAEGVIGDLSKPSSLVGVLDGIEKAFLLPGYPRVARAMADVGVSFMKRVSTAITYFPCLSTLPEDSVEMKADR